MAKDITGQRIRHLREQRGISASELARLVEVTPTAVWNWEHSGTHPRPGVLTSIAKVLGVTKEFLTSSNMEKREIVDPTPAEMVNTRPAMTVAEIIENARAQIAQITGISPERVKLQVQFVSD